MYIEQTASLEKRLERHNGLLPTKSSSYTNINKGFWEVTYKEKIPTRDDALKKERYLKSHVGRDWLKSIGGL